MALSDKKHTIFFFCLDPSLQTKTTAVLNTKYESRKKEYWWSQGAWWDDADSQRKLKTHQMQPTVALSSIFLRRQEDWSTSHLYGEADRPWKDRQPIKWTRHQQSIFSISHRMENRRRVFLPLFFHHSARGWADQRRLQTPRGSSASRWCGWQLCSSLSWQLHTNSAIASMGCNWFNHVWAASNLITSSYHRGGNALHCLGLWVSKAPLARGGTSVPSGWAWSGMTPAWKSAAVWGCAHLRRPWNLGLIWLEWPRKELMDII